MQGKPVVSLVVPFYNEGVATERFFSAITSAIDSLETVEFEIVCVDD
jgi:glycosyltransferase involved in cell wall biosynthesis